MARSLLFTTLFFCFLSLGSSKKKPDKIPISPISILATTDMPLPCVDTGCKSHFGEEAACVNVLHGNWSLINNEYKINTDYVSNLCRGSFDDCCRCFRRKIPTTTTTTTTTTAPTTTTTTTTTSTTTTTPTTTRTTPPVGCIDVDGSCRAAFGGAGACIDVRTGNLTDIDPEVTPLANKCGLGPEKCCECFKKKTAGCCKTLYTKDDEAVFHLTDTYNNKPVYKYKNAREEFCIYYGKQWMIGKCEAIYKGKTGDSKGVMFLSKSNVDCPNEIKTGDWYYPDGKEAQRVSFSCACCETLRFAHSVVHLADTHNNRPVYKDRKEEYCVYYGEQWMVRKCKAFYEDPTGNKGVVILSKANVDCPNQIETGHWYYPDGKQEDGSFTCECCKAIQYGKESYFLEDTHNNRPVYKDSKEEYCIYYGKQWLVRSCKAFYEDKNGKKGVKLLNKANVDCPVQIGGNMYWYTPDGKEIRDVSFSCVPPSGY